MAPLVPGVAIRLVRPRRDARTTVSTGAMSFRLLVDGHDLGQTEVRWVRSARRLRQAIELGKVGGLRRRMMPDVFPSFALDLLRWEEDSARVEQSTLTH